jgi:hypothetical protein
VDRNTGAGTNGGGLTLQAGGALSGGSNYNGGTLTLASGVATGTGTSAIEFKTASGGTSGAVDSAPTTKMTILGNGNVGIGTTAPGAKFDIGGSGESIRLSGGAAQTFMTFLNGSTRKGYVGTGAGGTDMIFNVDSGSIVLQGGNVGIGTTAPIGTLDVGTAGSICLGGSCKTAWPASGNQWTTVGNDIYKNNAGNVGIGTTAPTAPLDVRSTVTSFGTLNSVQSIHSANQGPYIASFFNDTKSTTTPAMSYYGYDNGDFSLGTFNGKLFLGAGGTYSGGSTTRMTIDNSTGSVGIGTTTPSYTLHVNGSVAGVGSYVALSDIRYKKNIQDLADSLAKVLAIRGVSYNWMDEKTYGSDTQFGVIAQEIEQIVPEVVTTGSDGVKRVRYSDLIPLVIEALKAEKISKDAEIARLKAESAQLKARADRAEVESAQLKAALCHKFPDLPVCGQ